MLVVTHFVAAVRHSWASMLNKALICLVIVNGHPIGQADTQSTRLRRSVCPIEGPLSVVFAQKWVTTSATMYLTFAIGDNRIVDSQAYLLARAPAHGKMA
jgi:hypothetical protein